MIDRTISHYRILEKLGEGGMGIVYRARDTKLDRDVALKFLPDELVESSDSIIRFEQEAKALSTLNHPNIATIHDIAEEHGKKCLVMEFIPGGTLRGKIRALAAEGREFTIREILDFGIQIADGLAVAHENGIVHRDVKTENMMLTGRGTVKITDFGLAKLRGGGQLTRSGSTVGTAEYMSPEQITGADVDARSDLFSLGIVLYELTTSRLPFRGEHPAAIAYSIVNEEPDPVSAHRRDAPAALERLIGRCLEKDPSRRYQSARQVASDLDAMRVGTGGAGRGPFRPMKRWAVAGTVAAVAAAILIFNVARKSPPPGGVSDVRPAIFYSGIVDNYLDTSGINFSRMLSHFRLSPLPDSLRSRIDRELLPVVESELYPGRVLTRWEVENDLAREGKVWNRVYGRDTAFFVGGLGCTDAIILHMFRVDPPYEGDSMIIVPSIFFYRDPEDGSPTVSAIGGFISHTSNPDSLPLIVGGNISAMLKMRNKRNANAKVVSAASDRVVIGFRPSFRPRVGMRFYATRSYQDGEEGLKRRLSELDEAIAYCSARPGLENELEDARRRRGDVRAKLEAREENPTHRGWNQGAGYEIELIDVYDSTAAARVVWRDDPWIRPAIGDGVHLK